MNPVLPLNHFVPDGEAREWADGRLHVYGSYDISGDTFYCSKEYHAFSTADLINWDHHGVSFSTHDPDGDVAPTEFANQTLFAPDCIYKDGLYRLYFCTAGDGEGVATSQSPTGPFTNPQPVTGAHGDAIDPAVFVDDDGAVYYYWGQFHARGARLNDQLNGIDPTTLNTELINEDLHGFHEGASVRKRGGIYYLVYADISRGRPTALGYATSENPLGPFTKRGIIIDNAGCDPETWNDHGSIAEFKGDWYVFYHRSSQGSRFSRRLCIEPIHFNDDGTIDEVEMTTQGVDGPLDPRVWMDASRACLMGGSVRAMAFPGLGGESLSSAEDGDTAAYKYFDFGASPSRWVVDAASKTYGGRVALHLDTADGPVIGSCDIEATGDWNRFERFSCSVSPVTGVHALWLVFSGRDGRLFDLRRFRFE